MVVPAGAEVTLYWSLNGALAMNRLGAQITGNPIFAQALADSLGSAIKATFTADLGGQFTSQTQLVRVGIRDLRADNLHEFRDVNAAAAGTAIGDALPGNVAMCITLRTATAGKSGRGRVFLSGWSEAANGAAGSANTTAQSQGVLFIQHLDINFQSAGLKLGVLTRPQEEVIITKTTNHADNTTTVRTLSHQTAKPGAVKPVNFIESRNLGWESQRKRINGRGLPPATLFGGLTVETPMVP